MTLVVLLLLIGAGLLIARSVSQNRQRQALEERRVADLDAVRKVADEDVTRFGEELQRLDADLLTETLDEPTRQDYQRALDSYESAKDSMTRLTRSEDVRLVTEQLEDGRYAVACVRARRDGKPLPVRRPPCFFNPSHGPSMTDVEWAPPGGQPRRIPVCGADAERLAQGAEPDIRTVPQGAGRVPYWNAGPAYSPWAMGYFSMYAATGLLPAFMLGSLLSSDWDGVPADGFDTGEDFSGDGGDSGDGGGDGGGDFGGDSGDMGDGSGGGDGDFGGGDFGGGDFGGGDFGGFGDFGGGDFGF